MDQTPLLFEGALIADEQTRVRRFYSDYDAALEGHVELIEIVKFDRIKRADLRPALAILHLGHPERRGSGSHLSTRAGMQKGISGIPFCTLSTI